MLVQRLMEEDDAPEAAVDAVIRTEENLPELSAVLLRVVHTDLGQALPHAACGGDMHNEVVIVLTVYLIVDCVSKVSCRETATDPQTRPQPGCPSLEKQYAGQSHVGLSSAPRTAPGTGASS